jgi:hypothetical protein
LRNYAASRKVAGSSPDDVHFINLPHPSSRTGPGVGSASNRNQYQESSVWGGGGVKERPARRLATLPPSVSRLSRENMVASKSHNRMGFHGLLTAIALSFYFFKGVIVKKKCIEEGSKCVKYQTNGYIFGLNHRFHLKAFQSAQLMKLARLTTCICVSPRPLRHHGMVLRHCEHYLLLNSCLEIVPYLTTLNR